MGVDFRTQAIHAGYEPLDNGRAAVPPIYASAAFDLGDAARGDALAGGDIDGFEYSRVANPTVDALEKRLAALEGGIGAVAVGSLWIHSLASTPMECRSPGTSPCKCWNWNTVPAPAC